jgi:hypothetical protein
LRKARHGAQRLDDDRRDAQRLGGGHAVRLHVLQGAFEVRDLAEGRGEEDDGHEQASNQGQDVVGVHASMLTNSTNLYAWHL